MSTPLSDLTLRNLKQQPWYFFYHTWYKTNKFYIKCHKDINNKSNIINFLRQMIILKFKVLNWTCICHIQKKYQNNIHHRINEEKCFLLFNSYEFSALPYSPPPGLRAENVKCTQFTNRCQITDYNILNRRWQYFIGNSDVEMGILRPELRLLGYTYFSAGLQGPAAQILKVNA